MRAGGRDIDDASPTRLQHVGQHRLDHVEHPVQVDVDHPLPILERDVGEALEAVQAGRVDENQDRSQPFPDFRQRRVDLRAVGDIRGVAEVVTDGLRSMVATLRPSARRRCATARPMPDPPPVTTAVLTVADSNGQVVNLIHKESPLQL